jgi:hypothetical protein
MLFDRLIADYPEFATRLGAESTLVRSKTFENGLVKLLRYKESELTTDEKEQLKGFLKSTAEERTGTVESGNETYVQRALKKPKLLESLYVYPSFVSPTSNICERSFSKAR